MDMNHVPGLEKQSFGYCGDYGKPKKQTKNKTDKLCKTVVVFIFLVNYCM